MKQPISVDHVRRNMLKRFGVDDQIDAINELIDTRSSEGYTSVWVYNNQLITKRECDVALTDFGKLIEQVYIQAGYTCELVFDFFVIKWTQRTI